MLIGIPYLLSPIYKFPDVSVFKGEKIYNPYKDMDSTHWRKANFHAHSRMLFGFTDGRKSPTENIIETYQKLGFEIIGISDYMHLNEKSSVPVYEHGFGLIKNHALIFGAKKVNWLDMMFNQNIHNKQFLINQLKDDENIYAVAHPSMRGAFNPGDFRYLTGYDLIEILRFDRVMTEYLDSALSTGHKAFLLADDDMHDFNNPREVGQCYNLINCDSLSSGSIFSAVKSGTSIGVKTLSDFQSFESKIADVKNIPVVKNISLNGLRISLHLSTPAHEIKFIGQYGIVEKLIADTSFAEYDFKPEDTYIRLEVTFEKLRFYFNPFFRYDDNTEYKKAEIDFWKTFLYRAFIVSAISFTVIFIYLRRKKFTFN